MARHPRSIDGVPQRGECILYAFTIGGELLDYVDTGLGPNTLMGVEVVSKDEIWVVDSAHDQVVRITPVE